MHGCVPGAAQGVSSVPSQPAQLKYGTYFVKMDGFASLGIYQARHVGRARRAGRLRADVVQDELRERHVVARGHELCVLRAEDRHRGSGRLRNRAMF